MNPRENLLHWDSITRSYVFKLRLNQSVETVKRLVLTAVFESPYDFKRLFAKEYEFANQ